VKAPARLGLWLAALAIAAGGCSRPPVFQGTALEPPRAPLDFSLRDQHGRWVRLSDQRGRVVVLTFLYTSCTETCELVTRKLRTVADQLDDRRREVTLLAVTVDPARDTVPRIAAYSRKWGMLDRWHLLTGSERDLRPLWRYYWVGDVGPEPADHRVTGASDPEIRHASPVHLIDRAGRVRVAYSSEFAPGALAHDILVLLGLG
jgi:protein SCO1